MGAIPGTVETDTQPPMTVPLRHFVVGLGFLLVGALAGLGVVAGTIPGLGTLAHVHLLLAGWVCLTIMGAMTQFVPVWSGVELYSHRLASVQLVLVVAGLVGFVGALLMESLSLLVPFGGLMLAGFWTFVYNIVRTLAAVDGFDVTERHFLYALGFFVVLTTLGVVLAVDFTRPVVARFGIERPNVVATHATVAVFGAVLTTIYGALYQLGTMFTQTELRRLDYILQRIEELAHPTGVVCLAVGRLGEIVVVARIGVVLILLAALAISTILGRKLFEMQVERTPMHTRYAVVVPALVLWTLLTAPAWLRAPTRPEHLLGAAGTAHLLVLAAVGFVVLGTLYHIVPFIVWVHRYSDLLGFEEVPMVDDLYDDQLAAADAVLLTGGTVLLVGTDWLGLPEIVRGLGGSVITLGVVIFVTNMLLVVRTHSPHSLGRILLGTLDPRTTDAWSDEAPSTE